VKDLNLASTTEKCDKLLESKYAKIIGLGPSVTAEDQSGYTMAEYIEGLYKKFGANSAMFAFENFVALQFTEELYERIMKDQFSSNDNTTGKKTYDYGNPFSRAYLRFHIDNTAASLDHYESIKTLGKFAFCLNKTVLEPKTKHLMNRWRNPLLALVNNRYGKSISNTDFVYSLNPHSATQIKGGTEKRFLGAEHGIVGHFRSHDIGTGLNNFETRYLDHPITMLKVDIEYFMYLVRNYKMFA
jgi:hypothetical protein